MLLHVEHVIVAAVVVCAASCCLVHGSSARATTWRDACRLGCVEHFRLYSFFDASEQLASPVRYHSEELATAEAVVADGHTAVPNADDHHDVPDVHFLQDCEQLVTRAILTVVVKSLREHLFLLHGVQLTDTVGQNPIFSRCEFGAGLGV